MPIKMNGSTSGYSQISAASTAGNNSLTLPTVDSAILTAALIGVAQNTTSGTSKDWAIPSGVKRLTVNFDGVSTNGSSPVAVQLGTASGIESTGYSGRSGYLVAGAGGSNGMSAGFHIYGTGGSTNTNIGSFIITNMDGNKWNCIGNISGNSSNDIVCFLSGTKTLSATLTTLRVTTVNGTDTFDAGSVNVIAEYF